MSSTRPSTRGDKAKNRGQAMVEFALIAPVFFLVVFGIIEFGLMMFDITTTRFAAGEAARVEAQAGTLAPKCSDTAGCPTLFGPTYAALDEGVACDAVCQVVTPPTCDADCQALLAIHKTALGGNTLEKINYVEIQKMTSTKPGILDDPATPVLGACERYNFDGSMLSGPLACDGYDPETQRETATGKMDYIQVNINFTYVWLTGMFSTIAKSPTFDSTFIVRLEPQKF